ncbi:MAG: metalloregulator ArsR/SmtB family transcription factor [Candidatus Eisenbacteria bacterium]|nr:metalloregulator ArsR/SmtB family transcription factor [Candidatus Eisenbacteria bacterium]
MKALAHPTRLFLVDALSGGEKSVAELTRMVGADISTVSKHLALLRTVGLVRDRKRGTRVFYSLQAPCILNFFGCLENVLRTAAEEQLRLAVSTPLAHDTQNANGDATG